MPLLKDATFTVRGISWVRMNRLKQGLLTSTGQGGVSVIRGGQGKGGIHSASCQSFVKLSVWDVERTTTTASLEELAAAADRISHRLRRRIAAASLPPGSSRPSGRVTCRRVCQKGGISSPPRLFRRLFLRRCKFYDGFDNVVMVPVGSIARICNGGDGRFHIGDSDPRPLSRCHLRCIVLGGVSGRGSTD